MRAVLTFLCLVIACTAHADPKHVRVFVALCDNESQGIVPVGEKIGDGDDPDSNLYWGCSDGFGAHFRRSSHWKVTSEETEVSPIVLRRLRLSHVSGGIELTAEAYRGSSIRQCIEDFEKAAGENTYDLVAFIGHNGLMDFDLSPPKPVEGNDTEVAVLCCLSEKYFAERLKTLGCRPILMTRQFMYPGAFILDTAIESWREGGSPAELRVAAGRAYAQNQKISVRAATGVFAPLTE